MNPSEKKLYVIDADGVSFFDNPLEPITPVDVVTLLNPDPVVSHVGLNVGDIITAGQIPFEEFKALWENIGDKTGVQVHLTYDMGSRLITLNNPREVDGGIAFDVPDFLPVNTPYAPTMDDLEGTADTITEGNSRTRVYNVPTTMFVPHEFDLVTPATLE